MDPDGPDSEPDLELPGVPSDPRLPPPPLVSLPPEAQAVAS